MLAAHRVRPFVRSEWRPLRLLYVTTAIFALFPVGPAPHAAPKDPARRGADWLVQRQQANGAFLSTSQAADETAATLAAVVAGGVRGVPVARALAYIEDNGEERATRGSFTGRIIAGAVAGGADPRDFGGVDYVEVLTSQYNPVTGAYDSSFLANLLAANGLLAAREGLPRRAIEYIRSNGCPNGGFGSEDLCGAGPDVEASAWAINVLVAADEESDPAVGAAREFLRSVQNDDGGFGRRSDEPTRSDTTGLAISAIHALGENPKKGPWRQPDGDQPTKALKALQDSSGGFRTLASDQSPNGRSTVSAVPAMAGSSYPIPAMRTGNRRPPRREPAPPAASGRKTEADSKRDEGERVDAGGEQVPETETPRGGSPLASSVRTPSSEGGQSFSRPEPYRDPSERLRLLAWPGLGVSAAMVTLGVWLLRRAMNGPSS